MLINGSVVKCIGNRNSAKLANEYGVGWCPSEYEWDFGIVVSTWHLAGHIMYTCRILIADGFIEPKYSTCRHTLINLYDFEVYNV